VKAGATYLKGATFDATIDRLIATWSAAIEEATNTRFVPVTETRRYDIADTGGRVLYLDAQLLSVTTLTDDDGARTWTEGTHFELEPRHAGRFTRVEALADGPYRWSSAGLGENAISIAGDWGYSADLTPAGTITEAISSATATTIKVSNGALVGVGDTLRIGAERMFVSGRSDLDLAVNTSGAFAAQRTATTLALSGAPTVALNVGEILRIGSELMRITAINTTSNVEVERAWDGSTLGSHANDADVYVQRQFTVTRGEGGTTAATHLINVAVSRYVPPADVTTLITEQVIDAFLRERAGGGSDTQSAGPTSQQFDGMTLWRMRDLTEQRRRFWR
jgi:hypothetical protein